MGLWEGSEERSSHGGGRRSAPGLSRYLLLSFSPLCGLHTRWWEGQRPSLPSTEGISLVASSLCFLRGLIHGSAATGI